MQNTHKIAPGQKGAKKLLDQYGAQLLGVRYRYDQEKRKRFNTIELVIEGASWLPPVHILNETLVGV